MAKGPASSASSCQQWPKQSTRKSLRMDQAYYNPFTQYLPSLQQFAAQRFPEPDIVSLYVIVIGGFFFPSISFSSSSLNFCHSFLQQGNPCLKYMSSGEKRLPFTSFEPATCLFNLIVVWGEATHNYSLVTLHKTFSFFGESRAASHWLGNQLPSCFVVWICVSVSLFLLLCLNELWKLNPAKQGSHFR